MLLIRLPGQAEISPIQSNFWLQRKRKDGGTEKLLVPHHPSPSPIYIPIFCLERTLYLNVILLTDSNIPTGNQIALILFKKVISTGESVYLHANVFVYGYGCCFTFGVKLHVPDYCDRVVIFIHYIWLQKKSP